MDRFSRSSDCGRARSLLSSQRSCLLCLFSCFAAEICKNSGIKSCWKDESRKAHYALWGSRNGHNQELLFEPNRSYLETFSSHQEPKWAPDQSPLRLLPPFWQCLSWFLSSKGLRWRVRAVKRRFCRVPLQREVYGIFPRMHCESIATATLSPNFLLIKAFQCFVHDNPAFFHISLVLRPHMMSHDHGMPTTHAGNTTTAEDAALDVGSPLNTQRVWRLLTTSDDLTCFLKGRPIS